jgi:hypothetical protein
MTMRREEMLIAETVAKQEALKRKAAEKAAGTPAKPAPGLLSPSSIAAIVLLLLGIGTFIAMLMKSA